jgi:hypothetical protein
MAQTYATLRSKILNTLNDASSTIFAAADLDKFMEDALRDISLVRPHIVKIPYTVEGRYGEATSTSANNLVDITKSQFLSSDVNKMVYNTTDKTWAIITSYSSATTVGLSKDIMESGESYKIFNKNCTSSHQLNIEDVTDYLYINKVEYPLGGNPPFFRNVDSVEDNILTIGIDVDPNDTSISTANKDAYVYFAKRNKLSQLTDFSATLSASALAGATSLALTSMQGAGTIEADQELTISGVRGLYTVKSDTTIASSASSTVPIFPAVESTASSTTVVTLRSSTLKPELEPILVDYVAGMAAISKSAQPLQEVINAIAVLAIANTSIVNMTNQIAAATAFVSSGSTQTVASTTDIAAASTAIAKIDAQIGAATTAIAAGTVLFNTITTTLGAENDYLSAAASDVNAGIGYLREGIAYIQQAQADQQLSGNYLNLAGAGLANDAQYLNQGMGYLRKISSQLSIAAASDTLKVWGQQKLIDAHKRLSRLSGTNTFTDYSRD